MTTLPKKLKEKKYQEEETQTVGFTEYFEPTHYEWEQNGFKVVADKKKGLV